MAVNVSIFPNAASAAHQVADEIAALIRAKPDAVLGLATGGTPLLLYRELIRMHQDEGLSFRDVRTFNLDEYEGLPPEHVESYWHFMHRHLFEHLDIRAENIHIPAGMLPLEKIDDHCASFEQAIHDAGGIDFQLLGIGRNGHIGFNEPGSAITSRTRRVTLCDVTRTDAAAAFGLIDDVPKHAITMGCGTILEAKSIALLAFGEHKKEIVRQALQGSVTDQVSASYLQNHPNTCFYLDAAASSELAP